MQNKQRGGGNSSGFKLRGASSGWCALKTTHRLTFSRFFLSLQCSGPFYFFLQPYVNSRCIAHTLCGARSYMSLTAHRLPAALSAMETASRRSPPDPPPGPPSPGECSPPPHTFLNQEKNQTFIVLMPNKDRWHELTNKDKQPIYGPNS